MKRFSVAIWLAIFFQLFAVFALRFFRVHFHAQFSNVSCAQLTATATTTRVGTTATAAAATSTTATKQTPECVEAAQAANNCDYRTWLLLLEIH